MKLNQISVFVENRKGRLGEVLNVLKKAGVNILSLSLADTAEYGLLRVIADDPQRGKEALSQAGFSAIISEVFVVSIPHTPGALQTIMEVISEEELSVEYMYGLSSSVSDATVVVKTSDAEKAEKIFRRRGIRTVTSL